MTPLCTNKKQEKNNYVKNGTIFRSRELDLIVGVSYVSTLLVCDIAMAIFLSSNNHLSWSISFLNLSGRFIISSVVEEELRKICRRFEDNKTLGLDATLDRALKVAVKVRSGWVTITFELCLVQGIACPQRK